MIIPVKIFIFLIFSLFFTSLVLNLLNICKYVSRGRFNHERV